MDILKMSKKIFPENPFEKKLHILHILNFANY